MARYRDDYDDDAADRLERLERRARWETAVAYWCHVALSLITLLGLIGCGIGLLVALSDQTGKGGAVVGYLCPSIYGGFCVLAWSLQHRADYHRRRAEDARGQEKHKGRSDGRYDP